MYEEALEYFLRSQDVLKSDDPLNTNLLNNIGEIYRECELYDKALEYYRRAISFINDKYSSSNHAAILCNIGEVYFSTNSLSKALESYEKSYNILIKGKDMISLGEVENRIGKVYFEMGDLDTAEVYYSSSLKRLKMINNKYYAIDTLINIAQLYSENALEYYKEARGYALEVNSKKKLLKIYQLMSEHYENRFDYQEALKYYKEYFYINQEIVNLNLKNKLEILNIDIENIKTKEKIDYIKAKLENEINRQKNELKRIKKTNEILERQAYEDELTGVKNRRSINNYLKEFFERDLFQEDKIVLFIIDIDRFKRYNDYWGHSQGDICIKQISEHIERIQTERDDIFGRYGGEEFIYISTNIDYEEALKLGDRIRKEIEDIGIYYLYKGEEKPITISMGGVIGEIRDFDSMADVIEKADIELYKAKQNGRNTLILKYIEKATI